MIEEILADLYEQLDHTVKVVGTDNEKTEVFPTEDDLRVVLDNAAAALYTEPVGARMNIASLIIEKRTDNRFDVYKYVGEYN